MLLRTVLWFRELTQLLLLSVVIRLVQQGLWFSRRGNPLAEVQFVGEHAD